MYPVLGPLGGGGPFTKYSYGVLRTPYIVLIVEMYFVRVT